MKELFSDKEVEVGIADAKKKYPAVEINSALLKSAADFVLKTMWNFPNAPFKQTLGQSLGNTSKWTKDEKQAHYRAITTMMSNRSLAARHHRAAVAA
jgi:hypothetical protein